MLNTTLLHTKGTNLYKITGNHPKHLKKKKKTLTHINNFIYKTQ